MAGARELAAVLRIRDEGSAEIAHFRGEIEHLDQKFGSIPASAAAAGAAVVGLTATLAALAAAAFELGSEFDEAFDAITIKSGQTGAALEALQDDFKQLATATPSSFKDAADAIGLLNARTGQTGEGLQALAAQELTLARITKTDLGENIRQTTRLFGDWGIATDDQALTLDKLFKAAQLSGSSVSALSQTIVQFGAPMRQLGFDIDQSIALLAKFEREGVNTETVLGTMRIALAKMAETGFDPKETFGRLVTTIRDMEDPLEATALAMEVFGKRGGADMAAAIREGRFSIEEMQAAVEDAGGAIEETRSKTDDAKEDMTTAFNAIKLAGEPIATTVFEAMGSAAKLALPFIGEFATSVDAIAKAIKSVKDGGPVKLEDLIGLSAGEIAKGAVNDLNRFTGGQGNLGTQIGDMAAATGQTLDAAGRALPGAQEAENRRIAEENWRLWADAEKAAALAAIDDVSDTVDAAAPKAAPKPLSAAEIAQLRKDTADAAEAAREAARIKREQEREAAAAVKEAERILKEQERQAEREAEIEARRINTIRELEGRRVEAINEAIQHTQDAIDKAKDQTDERIRLAEEEFARTRAIDAQRKQLTDERDRAVEGVREGQAEQGRSVSDARSLEDISRRRDREDFDHAARLASQVDKTKDSELKAQQAINDARFKGDVLLGNRLQLQLEQQRKGAKDQGAIEEAAIILRRQREDEDFALRQVRRTEDLAAQKANAAELKASIEELSKPLEAFNAQVLQDNLDKKILDYIKARDELIGTANERLTDTTLRENIRTDQAIDKANQGGLTQQVILNNYNYGMQGEQTVEDMVDELLDEAASRLAQTG